MAKEWPCGPKWCVLILYLRFLQESQRRGAYDGQGVAVRPEVVVVGGARHARGAVCAACEHRCVVRRGGWLGPQWGRSGAGGGVACVHTFTLESAHKNRI